MARLALETLPPILTSQMKFVEQLKIFSDIEVKAIKSHRKLYEKAFSRDKISCEDILLYVRYELDLLAVIREKNVSDELLKTKNTVMFSSANILNKLFSVLTEYYPEKLQLWFLYVKFCREIKDNFTLLNVLEKLLKVHQDKPFVYQLAARVAREDLRNSGKARSYLMSGIRTHIDSQELYREAFLMELAVSREKFENTEGADPDNPIFRKTLDHVYKAARMKIHQVDFYIDLFHLLKGLPFAEALENRIHDDLRKMFPKHEVMWETLANVKYERLQNPINAPNFRKIIEELIGIYKTAVEEHLNTPLMWSLYIDKVLQIHNDASIDGISNFKKNCLNLAFTTAHHNKQLTVKHYLIWAEMQKDEERKLTLLQIAAESLPTNVTLWKNIFSNRLAVNDEKGAWKLFEESLSGFKNNKKESLPLWKFMARYFQMVARPERMEWLYEQAISESSGVGAEMKPEYLEWVTLSSGIASGRELYGRIASLSPFSMALHHKMFELENLQVKVNVRSLRQVHELASEQFGSHDINIWMEWIKFEYSLGKSRKIILTIKDKAVALLQPALIDEFSSEMRLFEIECITSSKQQTAIQDLHSSLCRVTNRKRGSATPARYNGKSKKSCV